MRQYFGALVAALAIVSFNKLQTFWLCRFEAEESGLQ